MIAEPRWAGGSEAEGWRHRPDVEGLRAIAILMVILYHAEVPGLSGGYLGVDVFFVLSGFLILGIIADEVGRTGRLSLRHFWARRCRRLLPASIVMTLVVLLGATLIASPFAVATHARAAIYSALYGANLLFAETTANYFDGDAHPNLLLHMWSLSAEEQFYLVAAPVVAAIALVAAARGTRWFRPALSTIVLLLTLGSLAACVQWQDSDPIRAFYLLPTRMWELGVGGLIALQGHRLRLASRPLTMGLAMVGGLGLLGATVTFNSWTVHPGWTTLAPVLCTAALLVAGDARGAAAGTTALLATPPLKLIGRLSYSWYLWQWPLLVLLADLVDRPSIPQRLAVSVLALGIAAASFRWVEQPVRRSAWLTARPGLTIVAAVFLSAGTALVGKLVLRDATRASNGPAVEWAEAARRKPQAVNDGCLIAIPVTDPGTCVYGHPDATTTVVLFGDSHMLQWFPAVEQAAIEGGWRLVLFGKAACPSVSVAVMYVRQQRAYPQCSAWRDEAFARIAALRPAVVLVSNFGWYPVVVNGRPRWTDTDLAAQRAWESGMEETLGRLTGSAGRVVVVRDSPYPRINVPDCLSRRLASPTRCAQPYDAAVDTAIASRERRAIARMPGVRYVDFTPQICAGGSCPAVSGDTVRYRDTNHLTVEYVTPFASLFSRIIGDALARTMPAAPAVRSPPGSAR